MPSGARMDHLHRSSNGVDLEYFAPRGQCARRIRRRWCSRESWITGRTCRGCSGSPTPFAAHPGAAPDIRFIIVGSKPTEAVRRLAERPGIEVTGFVQDVRTYVADAAVCVAPLTIARGVQNKVLEAMAMGKAVVCTPQALEGIRVPPVMRCWSRPMSLRLPQGFWISSHRRRARRLGRRGPSMHGTKLFVERQSTASRHAARAARYEPRAEGRSAGDRMSTLATLHVRERAGIARAGDAIRTGVPLARGALTDPSACLLVADDGRAIPAQFKVLAAGRTAASAGCWSTRSSTWLPVKTRFYVRATPSNSGVRGIDVQEIAQITFASTRIGRCSTYREKAVGTLATVSIDGTACSMRRESACARAAAPEPRSTCASRIARGRRWPGARLLALFGHSRTARRRSCAPHDASRLPARFGCRAHRVRSLESTRRTAHRRVLGSRRCGFRQTQRPVRGATSRAGTGVSRMAGRTPGA